MSEAFDALDARQREAWDWRSATILFVSWDWGTGPEALAGRRLVAALLDAGARVHVLSAYTDDERRAPNYEVTAVRGPSLSPNAFVRTWQMMGCGVPEGAGVWVKPAVAAGRRVLATLPPETVVYGRAMPGASNVVAWHLGQSCQRPWVAHFSDPWPPLRLRSNRWNWFATYKSPMFQRWFRRIANDAGALTFTNPDEARSILGAPYATHVNKAFVVPHLASAPARPAREPQHDLFHIVHTGNLYSSYRHTSAALIEGLRIFLDRTPAARGRVRFTQAGWEHGDLPEWTERCALGDVVRNVGRLPSSDIPDLLDSASVLVGVDYARDDSTTVLSKLPDYIAAERPILAITATSSAMGRLFVNDGVGVTARYDAPHEVADRIGAIFASWCDRRTAEFLPKPSAVEAFSRRRALDELAGAFVVASQARTRAANSSFPAALLSQRTT